MHRTAFAIRWTDTPRVCGCAMIVLALCIPIDLAYARGYSRRGMMYRAQSYVNAQRQQSIKSLQQQVDSARKVLAQAESQASMSADDLQTARMTLQSVKSKVEEHQRETREAARKQRDLEGKIVANQAPDSELGKAEAALEESQLKLDAEVHRILKLPAHSGPTDEEDRFKERSRLNEDQRSQLHQDAEYQAALDGVRAASEEASRVRHALFAKDAEWQAAFKERQSSEQSMLAAEKEQHRSGMAAAAGRNQLRNASEVAAYARQLIGEGESQLSVLGVKPKAPPKTSGSSSGSGKTAK